MAVETDMHVAGKYNTSCFKSHVTIGLNGLILGHTGPHFGVDHDKRIWDDTQQELQMDPGEWGFGNASHS